MIIEKLPRYDRDVDKKVKLNKLTKDQIGEAEKLFEENPKNPSLRYHQIKCKKDKHRWSITIPNTQYRILVSDYGDKAYFLMLLDHKEYDRANKKC